MRVIADNPAHGEAFADRVRAFLMQDESENCFILGVLGARLAQAAKRQDPRLLLRIESDNQLVGVALQAPRRNHLAVTQLPPGASESLARHLAESNWNERGFMGPVPSVDRLADFWENHAKRTKRILFSLRLFELQAIIPPPPVPGRIMPAPPDQLELLTQWLIAFFDAPDELDEDPRSIAQQVLEEKRLYVWEHGGQLCAMAGLSGPTPNGIRISFVYTPPELRGRGYASNLVAALSQKMLSAGRKFCFLFTDVRNPTSNKIYQQIGYRPVCDFRHWVFDNAAKNGPIQKKAEEES